jgi:D-glycero-D-manno-heptose 1,7-bisphosphate phosphatase
VRRYVFLDRDGTLVRDTGYPHRAEDYELLAGVPAALRSLLEAGYRLAIVTNQSGIGRGCFDVTDFERFQERLLADLARENVVIDGSYHCPHRPEEGCGCRKPATGLLLRARDELGADLAASWVIGDGEGDLELARRGGCRGAVHLQPGAAPRAPVPGGPPGTAGDLAAAVALLRAADERA